MKAIALAAAMIQIAAASAQTTTTVPAAELRIIDGDTVALGQERIRLLDIDAPEIFHPHCRAELLAGEAAKFALKATLYRHRVTIDRHGTGRYGRTLAYLIVDGRRAGAILVSRGLALRYKSGWRAHRQRTSHWCGQGEW